MHLKNNTWTALMSLKTKEMEIVLKLKENNTNISLSSLTILGLQS